MRVEVDESASAVTWTVVDEPLQRSSHALAVDGRVWLVDPVDDPDALRAAEALGEVTGVLQLLDRHPRDCEALAKRYGVEMLRLPEAGVPRTPFVVLRPVWWPMWRELALWWPERRTLVVAEALGTVAYFAAGRRAGVHPFRRALPPRSLAEHDPEHLLVGHGPALHEDAGAAVREALDASRRDIPRAAFTMLGSFLPGTR